MKRNYALITFIIILASACSSPKSESEKQTTTSNEWELQIVDSIQVDYLADVREGIFNDGVGIIKDIMSTTLVKFDTTGKILAKKEYTKEGPGNVKSLETLLMHENVIFGTSSFYNIYKFDSNLEPIGTLEMPFMGEARGGAYNRRNIAAWNNKLLLWYPGREGISPYIDHFYRDYPLLELYDLATNTAKAAVRTPPTSQYSTNNFFNRPSINFTIENDSLYLTFSNEAQVHIYAMGDSIQWVRSMGFSPTDFKLIPGQKSEVTYSQSMQMHEARINGIYSDQNHIVIAYQGGIDGNTFVNNNLKERENFHRYPEFRNDYLKIYQYGFGWSNEMIIPSKVKLILNIESVDKPFYALRNDEYIGEEQDYMTFYKLQLVEK
ncbi:hypothetical protein SAMN04489724_3228 [Algoriphagus locisalis]|uniref:TolB-like 6-blade propeller-like n=1 Tax=Algoriphagus locisalis TaxID=305507 RepID=A0A1I7CIA4_9BACT|nr:hypothetical protein [Algoriphagus locisalis]SFT99153.1 hypothetical protein SAMN04489724_3228 [Algoriphagus locisalis]